MGKKGRLLDNEQHVPPKTSRPPHSMDGRSRPQQPKCIPPRRPKREKRRKKKPRRKLLWKRRGKERRGIENLSPSWKTKTNLIAFLSPSFRTHTHTEETRLPTDFFFSRHTAARKKGIEPLFSPPLFPQREMMFFVVRKEKEGRECKQGGRRKEKDFFPTLRDWCCYRVWVFSSFCPFYRKE